MLSATFPRAPGMIALSAVVLSGPFIVASRRRRPGRRESDFLEPGGPNLPGKMPGLPSRRNGCAHVAR